MVLARIRLGIQKVVRPWAEELGSQVVDETVVVRAEEEAQKEIKKDCFVVNTS